MFNQIPVVTKNLILINVMVFLACLALPALNPVLSGYYYLSPNFRPWQIVTHMFMHGGFTHIFFNMYALFIFGVVLENHWGPRRFLTYYLICGLGAFFLHEFVNHLEVQAILSRLSPTEVKAVVEEGYALIGSNRNYTDLDLAAANVAINVPVVGASGAVFGVLLAFGVLFPDTRLMLLFPPVALRAKWLVIVYGALELFLAVGSFQGDQIAHYAHVGGMLFGYLMLKYWQWTDKNRY